MKIQNFLLSVLLILLIPPGIARAVETGSALKADILRSEPYTDAQKTGAIARGEKLQILGKKGAWLNVKTLQASGWVRLLSVKRGAGGSGSSSDQVKGVLDLASGRAGTGKVVATTGVRGLNEEELKKAKYNETEMKKLESYTITSKQGQQFAADGGLQAVKFDYLPEFQREGEK